jgi:small subunit ribosomal protein S6
MNNYEALFILRNNFQTDEDVNPVIERIETEIQKLKGVIHEKNILGKRKFARPLKKKSEGFYVKIAFSMEPQNIVSLRPRLNLLEQIFRIQILKQKGIQKNKTEKEDK